jgi:predicted PurR-regulated permease PerM
VIDTGHSFLVRENHLVYAYPRSRAPNHSRLTQSGHYSFLRCWRQPMSKRQVVEISQQIESDISAYLVTITIMNAAVGIATAIAMWFTGVGDPILWGTAAFLLNYVPILGTALGVLIFLFAGLLTHDILWQALLPAGLYFGFHLIEGETVTPLLLAKRFTLNPVLIIISLAFWFWMWGIPGVILSMPMLAITKIICDRLQPLAAFGHFLEG